MFANLQLFSVLTNMTNIEITIINSPKILLENTLAILFCSTKVKVNSFDHISSIDRKVETLSEKRNGEQNEINTFSII